MSAVDLTPAEQLALTIARGQLERDEPVTPNVAQVLALAFVRAVDKPAPDDGAAVHLLTGPLPPELAEHASNAPFLDGGEVRLLVTVWGNGTGEVAYRASDSPRERWSAPAILTPAP